MPKYFFSFIALLVLLGFAYSHYLPTLVGKDETSEVGATETSRVLGESATGGGITLYTTNPDCTGEAFMAAIDEFGGEERGEGEIYLAADGSSYTPIPDSRAERTIRAYFDGKCVSLDTERAIDTLDMIWASDGELETATE